MPIVSGPEPDPLDDVVAAQPARTVANTATAQQRTRFVIAQLLPFR
jgi:hypothetical protein